MEKARRRDLFEHGVEETGELLLERRHRRHGREPREEARVTMKATTRVNRNTLRPRRCH